MSDYTDQGYAAELGEIRQRLIGMAARVEAMIGQSIKVFLAHDPLQAKETILSDHKINQDEIDLDSLCLQLLARRQPMASDLRFITTALKMVTDLERVGDLAVNICERAIGLASHSPLGEYRDISKMAEMAQAMVKDSIDAFIDADVDKAEKTIQRDDEVDDLYTVVFRDVLRIMLADSSKIEPGIQVQSVAKFLERMADHATNLSEEVIYMVRGTDVRHEGKL